jgi:hypothetical protein
MLAGVITPTAPAERGAARVARRAVEAGRPGSATLETRVLAVWRAISDGGRGAECLACGGELHRSGCRECGAELS